jgi:hypothetical protein
MGDLLDKLMERQLAGDFTTKEDGLKAAASLIRELQTS